MQYDPGPGVDALVALLATNLCRVDETATRNREQTCW